MKKSTELSRVSRRNRQMIYIGDNLRAVLANRKEPLSTVVNLMAERYMAIISRAGYFPLLAGLSAELFCNVLREGKRPLAAGGIALFPALVKDWLRRHPEFPQGPGETALMMLKNSSYLDLVALVDKLERRL